MPEERSLYLFASVLSAAIFGVEVCPVQVEADVSNGLPSFIMVGFPSAQVMKRRNGYAQHSRIMVISFHQRELPSILLLQT